MTSAPLPSPWPAELAATSDAERERAWASFVSDYTPILMRVARLVTHDHDSAMDAYTFVLGQLREDDFRRLSAYQATTSCTFETWLAVVARRLCVDHYRSKYGRLRGEDESAKEAHRERRRLVDLVGVELEQELPASSPDPAAALEQQQLRGALEGVVNALPASDKLLLRYRFDDELPAREIARLMKLPSLFHVYRRLNAILVSCRQALAARGVRGRDD